MKSLFTRQRPHKKGQSMVEFALALPLLLLLMVGIIEFARILQAWLAVQNSARFGLRYLVTGEYNPAYCEEATAALNLTTADTYGGDPANDCHIPDEYGNEARDLTNTLVDWARLPSAKDVAYVGATGVALDDSVSGNYLDFLTEHESEELGEAEVARYFHVTVCSSRDGNEDGFTDFQWNGEDSIAYQSLGVVTCYDSLNDYLMDDAGGPGDRVRVYVTFKHSTVVPFISEWWPVVPLTTWREGIVERFRTSRISGIGSEIVDVPTNTPTDTPTDTPTPSDTPTHTATSTGTATASTTPTSSSTPTTTPTPNCSVYSLGDFSISGRYLNINVINASSTTPKVNTVILDWDFAEVLGEMIGSISRTLYLDWIKFGGTTRWGSGALDYDSPTDTSVDSPSTWSSPTLGRNSTTVMQSFFGNNWTGFGTDGKLLGTDFGLTVYLDNGCILQRDVIERPLPEIDCDLYTISSPTLLNNGIVQFMMRNNDNYASNVSSIQIYWDYLEDFFETVVSPSDTSVRADWIGYDTHAGGDQVWGSAYEGGNDYESPTDTLTDITWSTVLPKAFDPALNYYLEVDFDGNKESGLASWLTFYGLEPGDFGALITFDNGCQIEMPVIPRPLMTPTPDCDLIYLRGAYQSSDDFMIRVQNDNFAPAYLTNSTLVWPLNWNSSFYFDYVQFNYQTYWNPTPTVRYSPVTTAAPGIALNGRSNAYWTNDFGNWPAVPAEGGLFSGDLLFDYNGLTCEVYGELMVYPTPTRTSTATRTTTYTITPTETATETYTPTSTVPTATPTNTSTVTDTYTPTDTATITDTPTNTKPPTNTYTPGPTNTATASVTSSSTSTIGPTSTSTPTATECMTPVELGGCH